MKAIMLMFDSLNRHMLPPYGCEAVHAPNFARLAQRTATFDRSWICSMPCMPARRDLHTGRPNFLHTGWSPLQPWDDSMPQTLRDNGTSTHLVTDHYHYFEDGGAGYHPRYSTWECFRGQESDPWKGHVHEFEMPENINKRGGRPSWVNRMFIKDEQDFPQTQTMNAGLEFLERNHDADNWFLQIETFDPHEPFISASKYQDLYEKAGESPLFDWPAYADVTETPEEVQRARDNYFALVSQCDANLGRLLDLMDREEMWDDTMLIVWADHGFLLGEHNRWAKNLPTMWREIANTPFFLWDPRYPEAAGQRRQALVQPAIDLAPTLLRFFGQEPSPVSTGKDLAAVMRDDSAVREGAIFGYYLNPINYTDGRYVYMRTMENLEAPGYSYNSMPSHMAQRWGANEWEGAELLPPQPYSRGVPVIRRPQKAYPQALIPDHMIFDLENDPGQLNPLQNEAVEERVAAQMVQLMEEAHAPEEIYLRYGLQEVREKSAING